MDGSGRDRGSVRDHGSGTDGGSGRLLVGHGQADFGAQAPPLSRGWYLM